MMNDKCRKASTLRNLSFRLFVFQFKMVWRINYWKLCYRSFARKKKLLNMKFDLLTFFGTIEKEKLLTTKRNSDKCSARQWKLNAFKRTWWCFKTFYKNIFNIYLICYVSDTKQIDVKGIQYHQKSSSNGTQNVSAQWK